MGSFPAQADQNSKVLKCKGDRRSRHKICSALTGTSSVRLVSPFTTPLFVYSNGRRKCLRKCLRLLRLRMLLQFGGWNHLGQSLLSTLLEDVREEDSPERADLRRSSRFHKVAFARCMRHTTLHDNSSRRGSGGNVCKGAESLYGVRGRFSSSSTCYPRAPGQFKIIDLQVRKARELPKIHWPRHRTQFPML